MQELVKKKTETALEFPSMLITERPTVLKQVYPEQIAAHLTLNAIIGCTFEHVRIQGVSRGVATIELCLSGHGINQTTWIYHGGKGARILLPNQGEMHITGINSPQSRLRWVEIRFVPEAQ